MSSINIDLSVLINKRVVYQSCECIIHAINSTHITLRSISKNVNDVDIKLSQAKNMRIVEKDER